MKSHQKPKARIDTVSQEVKPPQCEAGDLNFWKRRRPAATSNFVKEHALMEYLNVIFRARSPEVDPPNAQEVVTDHLHSENRISVFAFTQALPPNRTSIPLPGCVINAPNTAWKS
jgi:hypothetical protein